MNLSRPNDRANTIKIKKECQKIRPEISQKQKAKGRFREFSWERVHQKLPFENAFFVFFRSFVLTFSGLVLGAEPDL
jgi:hypothetical protein